MHWKVGELAKLANISVRTLHHYEQIGLLKPARRSDGGYRLYDTQNVQRLMQIVCLSQVGMSLDEVKQALADYPDDILPHLKQHLALLDQRLSQLQTVHTRLQSVISKIANNQQPSWIDWALNPDLIRLSDQWHATDAFDALALYESHLNQSARWQQLLAHETQNTAWDLVASFEALTDASLLCHHHLWHNPNLTAFAQLDRPRADTIRAQWAQQHRLLWQAQLTPAATACLNHTHAQALSAWPNILADLHQVTHHQLDPASCHHAWQHWCLTLGQGDEALTRQIMHGFLAEPRLQQGLCLNPARADTWQSWLNQTFTNSP